MNLARLGLLLAPVLVAGCSTADPIAVPCRNIPANGCPVDQGEACNDPTCAATYSCNTDGSWSLVGTCSGYHPAEAGVDATAAPPDAAPLRDVTGIDVPPGAYGGAGCVNLEPPDCPLGLALACPQGNADPCCGCESLYVCSDQGWTTWGTCSADGGLTQGP